MECKKKIILGDLRMKSLKSFRSTKTPTDFHSEKITTLEPSAFLSVYIIPFSFKNITLTVSLNRDWLSELAAAWTPPKPLLGITWITFKFQKVLAFFHIQLVYSHLVHFFQIQPGVNSVHFPVKLTAQSTQ